MTDSSNNVIDLGAFRKRRKAKADIKITPTMERFIEAYHEAGPEATDMFDKAMMLFKAYGFETDDFDHRDVVLLREALFSIILRYREQHHPLHTFVEDFDKYFNKLEYFLDTEWVKADFEEFDDEQPDPNEDEPA